jgi:hypothetical protein
MRRVYGGCVRQIYLFVSTLTATLTVFLARCCYPPIEIDGKAQHLNGHAG